MHGALRGVQNIGLVAAASVLLDVTSRLDILPSLGNVGGIHIALLGIVLAIAFHSAVTGPMLALTQNVWIVPVFVGWKALLGFEINARVSCP